MESSVAFVQAYAVGIAPIAAHGMLRTLAVRQRIALR